MILLIVVDLISIKFKVLLVFYLLLLQILLKFLKFMKKLMMNKKNLTTIKQLFMQNCFITTT